MDNNENHLSRGPLIAVIKIQLNQQKSDKIFLHLNDDDYEVAGQFVKKHSLRRQLITCIFDRILLSRMSVNGEADKTGKMNAQISYDQTPVQSSSRKQTKKINYQEQSFGQQLFPSAKKATYRQNQTFQNLFQDKQNNQEQHYESTKKYEKSSNCKNKQQDNPLPNFLRQENSYRDEKFEKQETKLPQQIQSRVLKSRCLSTINLPKNKLHEKPSRVKILKKEEIQSLFHPTKREVSQSQVKKINQDVTKRLYNEAQIKKNYLKIIKEKAIQDKKIQQDKQLTHKPQINRISKAIAQGRRGSKPLESYLIEQGKKIESKRQKEINKNTKKQIEQCSFQPQINQISHRLIMQKSRNSALSSRSTINLSKCNKNHAHPNKHHPQINQISQILMKQKPKFEERQKEFMQQKLAKLVGMVQQKRINELVDKDSKTELFKPQISTYQGLKQREQSVFDYLHNYQKQIPEPQPQHKPLINQVSSLLAQQNQFKRVSWIFSELDGDQDGVVSAQKISINNISTQILEIIKPVLFEMEEMNEELNLEQFRDAIQILHKKLDMNQKDILYRVKLT